MHFFFFQTISNQLSQALRNYALNVTSRSTLDVYKAPSGYFEVTSLGIRFLYACLTSFWPDVIALSFISLGLTLLCVLMIHMFGRYLLIGSIIFSCLGAVALSAVFWYSYSISSASFSFENSLPYSSLNYIRSYLEVSSIREIVYLLPICLLLTFVALLLIAAVIVIRRKLYLSITFFDETAMQSVIGIPLILLQPLVTSIIVLCFLAFVVSSAIYLAASQAVTVDTDGFAYYVPRKLPPTWLLLTFHVIISLWVLEFIYACQDMVIAGSMSRWYFNDDRRRWQLMLAPVIEQNAFLMRYGLGIAAFGSLAINVAQILRIFSFAGKKTSSQANFKSDNQTPDCQACARNFIHYSNRGAYVCHALFGDSFHESGMRAYIYELGYHRHLVAINSFSTLSLFLCKIGIALSTLLITLMWLHARNGFYPVVECLFPILIVCIVAYVMAACFLNLYAMAFEAIFICYCIDEYLKNDSLIALHNQKYLANHHQLKSNWNRYSQAQTHYVPPPSRHTLIERHSQGPYSLGPRFHTYGHQRRSSLRKSSLNKTSSEIFSSPIQEPSFIASLSNQTESPDPTSTSSPDQFSTPSPEKHSSSSPEQFYSPSPEKYFSPSPEQFYSPSPEKYPSPSPEQFYSPSPEKSISPSPEHLYSPSPEPSVNPQSPPTSSPESPPASSSSPVIPSLPLPEKTRCMLLGNPSPSIEKTCGAPCLKFINNFGINAKTKPRRSLSLMKPGEKTAEIQLPPQRYTSCRTNSPCQQSNLCQPYEPCHVCVPFYASKCNNITEDSRCDFTCEQLPSDPTAAFNRNTSYENICNAEYGEPLNKRSSATYRLNTKNRPSSALERYSQNKQPFAKQNDPKKRSSSTAVNYLQERLSKALRHSAHNERTERLSEHDQDRQSSLTSPDTQDVKLRDSKRYDQNRQSTAALNRNSQYRKSKASKMYPQVGFSRSTQQLNRNTKISKTARFSSAKPSSDSKRSVYDRQSTGSKRNDDKRSVVSARYTTDTQSGDSKVKSHERLTRDSKHSLDRQSLAPTRNTYFRQFRASKQHDQMSSGEHNTPNRLSSAPKRSTQNRPSATARRQTQDRLSRKSTRFSKYRQSSASTKPLSEERPSTRASKRYTHNGQY